MCGGGGGGAYFGRTLLSEFYGISKTQSNRHEFVAHVLASLQSGDLKSRLKSLLRSHQKSSVLQTSFNCCVV